MRDKITIGSVTMPLTDFVVSRNAILGITKSGKTYTAKGVAEQLLENDIRIVVFDAIGVWRYLKTPGEGRHAKGFNVVVAGGEHPDLPLTPHSAPEIVRASIQQNIPLIIDLYDSKLSKADWRRIVQSCFRVLLYENKGLCHVFLEESAEFAPQKVMDGETYAEVEKLARMGGNKHVGITFINQRAQELNKAVLELCDNVILLRQRGSHAIDALEKWLDRLSPDTAKEIADSMPHMTQGDCWIFTEIDSKPVRTHSGIIRSLHPDRRLPEQGVGNKKPVNSAMFVEKLTGKLGKLLEEQKANDPAELKKKIRELEKQIATHKPEAPKVETKEVSILTDEDRKLLQKVLDGGCDKVIESFEKLQAKTAECIADMKRFFEPIRAKLLAQPQRAENKPKLPVRVHAPSVPANRRTVSPSPNGEPIGGGLRRMMTALAQRGGLTKRQLGVRAGLSSSSGTFSTYLAKLRSNGWVDETGGMMCLTADGQEALGDYTPLPEGQALYEYWRNELGGGASRMLEALFENYPNPLTKEELGERAGISHVSGTFSTYLARMRTLELVTGKSELLASAEFFE